MADSLSQTLANRAERASFDNRARQGARLLVLDWCAVILAARRELTHDHDLDLCHGRSHELIGMTPCIPAEAALWNGRASHYLDFDDVLIEMPGHVSATVVSAALATAESENASIEHLIASVAGGAQVAGDLGMTAGVAVHERGWHPTAVFGAMAAGAAASLALSGDRRAHASAISLASLRSGGVLSAFGGVGKAWQVGAAARDGVQTAYAVRQGLTADRDYLPGVLDTMAPGWEAHAERRELAASTAIAAQVIYKRYPTCFATHAAIDCAREIAAAEGWNPGYIEGVRVTIGPRYQSIVAIRMPQTSLELKFSLSMLVAMSLLGSPPTTLRALEAFDKTDLRAVTLERSIEVVVDDSIQDSASRIDVWGQGGRFYSERAEIQSSFGSNEEMGLVVEKFRHQAEGLLAPKSADYIVEAVTGASAQMTVRALVAALGSDGAA